MSIRNISGGEKIKKENRQLRYSIQFLLWQEGCFRLPHQQGDPGLQDPCNLGQGYQDARYVGVMQWLSQRSDIWFLVSSMLGRQEGGIHEN